MFEISFKDTEIQLLSSSSLTRFQKFWFFQYIISYIVLHMIRTPRARITKKPQSYENKNYSGQELCGKVSNHLFGTSKFSFFLSNFSLSYLYFTRCYHKTVKSLNYFKKWITFRPFQIWHFPFVLCSISMNSRV